MYVVYIKSLIGTIFEVKHRKKGLIWGLVAFGVVATGAVLYFTVFKKKKVDPEKDAVKKLLEEKIWIEENRNTDK